MEITVTEASRVTVVVPQGDLDAASAAQVRRTLTDLLGAGKTRLVVDLGGVAYIDSATLAELVGAMKRARDAGGDLRLCALRGDVLQIFELTRLNQGMAVFPTREEAVRSWT